MYLVCAMVATVTSVAAMASKTKKYGATTNGTGRVKNNAETYFICSFRSPIWPPSGVFIFGSVLAAHAFVDNETRSCVGRAYNILMCPRAF